MGITLSQPCLVKRYRILNFCTCFFFLPFESPFAGGLGAGPGAGLGTGIRAGTQASSTKCRVSIPYLANMTQTPNASVRLCSHNVHNLVFFGSLCKGHCGLSTAA